MAFDPVTLFLDQDAKGNYFVSSTTVTWKGIEGFKAHGTDPKSNDADQPAGQPFLIGPSQPFGIYRTATLTFDPNAKIDDSTDDDNWHPCFTNGDLMKLAMNVDDHETQTLLITLCPAQELSIAIKFVRAIGAVATATLQFLIAVFTLRIFKHSKEEEELPEPAHTKGR